MDRRLEECLNGTVADKNAADQNAYLQRVSHLLAEGIPYTDVLVLAHGDVGGTAERLEQAAITFSMLTYEQLLSAEEAKAICECGAIVVPFSTEIPLDARERLDELAYGGVLVFFVGDEPTSTDENGLIFEGYGPVITVLPEDLSGMIRIFGHAHFTPSRKYSTLRFRHLRRMDTDVFLFLNTSSRSIGFCFDAGRTDVLLYDPTVNQLYKPQINERNVRVQIKAGASLFVIGEKISEEYPRFKYR
jgi:hypothetical protein